MYMDDDNLTPRDRISDNMLQRILGNSERNTTEEYKAEPDTRQNGRMSRNVTWGLKDYPLASVYAPLQVFRNLYDRDTALNKGTIFTELDLPFMGESVMKGGACRD